MTQLLKVFTAAAMLSACASMAALPEVSEEALSALGITLGTPQLNGFVFIDGKYVPPPYTVTRRGNGIFINRIQVAQPIAWVDAAAQPDEPKKTVDEDGDFEVVEIEETVEEEEQAPDNDDLLFGGATDTKEEAHAIDALFDDTPAVTKKKEPTRKPQQPTQPTNEPLSKKQIDEIKARLETIRKGYEVALGRGDFYFFSQRHSLVNGSYGSAKTLFSVLPSALRYAQSPQDLMAKLNQGGVYFLDLATCSDLYKVRMSFLQLEERQKQIEANEATKRTGRTR